jgi:hypothetical protein
MLASGGREVKIFPGQTPVKTQVKHFFGPI